MAIDEDVHVVAMSLLNGAHLTCFRRWQEFLKRREEETFRSLEAALIPESDRMVGDMTYNWLRPSPSATC